MPNITIGIASLRKPKILIQSFEARMRAEGRRYGGISIRSSGLNPFTVRFKINPRMTQTTKSVPYTIAT
jgi:hypothetical protein